MTQPETGPADVARVIARLGITGDPTPEELENVTADVAAVNGVVRRLPVAELVAVDVVEEWPERVTTGADMLAARLYRRRSTPSGVETFGDFGPVYVRRNDPDVAMLLELGDYARPQVG